MTMQTIVAVRVAVCEACGGEVLLADDDGSEGDAAAVVRAGIPTAMGVSRE